MKPSLLRFARLGKQRLASRACLLYNGEERQKSASKAGKAQASVKTAKPAKSETSSDASEKKTHQFSQFMKLAKRVKSNSEKGQSSTFTEERASASKKASPLPQRPVGSVQEKCPLRKSADETLPPASLQRHPL
jgi:hypothetical protein